MKFVCGQMWKIFGNLLLSLIWVANIILNTVAYVKETHWVSILGIVLCAIWLIIDIVNIVVTFRDLKRFCEMYDEQIKELLAAREKNRIMTGQDKLIKKQEKAEMIKLIGNVKPFYVETIAKALYDDAGYRKVDDLLKQFAKNLKAHILAIMLSGDKISCKDISNAKVILYYINRQLNDTFGLNEPLNAANQFLAEPELVEQYNLQEFINEVEK